MRVSFPCLGGEMTLLVINKAGNATGQKERKKS
jgi:hypothetical protein